MPNSQPVSLETTPASSSLTFQAVIPWEPWAKQRPRISKAVKGKGARTHQPPEDKKAEERTREFLREEWNRPVRVQPFACNVEVSAVFWRASRQTIDLDNLLKHLLDSATGVCWVNDCQVTAYGTMELQLDRDNPRTWVQVRVHENASLLRRYSPTTGLVLPA
jgi:Holliday junction resolvase RusA-like endonuclease